MSETKEVTYKHLKKGQKIHGTTRGNTYSSFSATVVDVNAAFVTVLMWDKNPEKIPTEETLFLVEMSEEEFRKKYKQDAIAVMKGLSNELSYHEIGYHEQWNGWLQYDPFEMGKNCRKHKLKVLGVCRDVWQRSGQDKEVGICVEEKDGTKFWCHAAEDHVEYMMKKFKYLLEEKQK